jgi:cytochrome c-type biogenesis protein CcmH
MMRAGWLAALLTAIGLASGAYAIDATPPLSDPLLQQRYLDLTHELRCMQCQNESIADSPVGLAADLRRDVREQLLAGKTDEDIRNLMVSRYGEFILFRPRLNWRNAWLWAAPSFMLLIGLMAVIRVLRQRARLVAGDTGPVDDEPLES